LSSCPRDSLSKKSYDSTAISTALASYRVATRAGLPANVESSCQDDGELCTAVDLRRVEWFLRPMLTQLSEVDEGWVADLVVGLIKHCAAQWDVG